MVVSFVLSGEPQVCRTRYVRTRFDVELNSSVLDIVVWFSAAIDRVFFVNAASVSALVLR